MRQVSVRAEERASSTCCDDREDGRVEEHGQQGSVTRCPLCAHGSDSAAQDAGVSVFGLDAGSGGAFEGRGGLAQVGADLLGGEDGQGVEEVPSQAHRGRVRRTQEPYEAHGPHRRPRHRQALARLLPPSRPT